ncbi:RICIN domain-containing protein [Kibdelosporangium persicum]|nr:RICIN domain-containing protein [Kibdelosporangium persicum]
MVLVVLGALAMVTTSAQAATERRIYHHQSELCLDGSVSQGIRLNKCNTNGYQDWEVINNHTGGDGTVFRHVESRLCLDASVDKGVRLNKCNYTTYQQWYRSTSGAKDLFHSQSHFCLDGSVSQGVRLNTCTDNNTYQMWTLF